MRSGLSHETLIMPYQSITPAIANVNSAKLNISSMIAKIGAAAFTSISFASILYRAPRMTRYKWPAVGGNPVLEI